MPRIATGVDTIESRQPIDDHQFTIASRLEITQLLSALMRQNALITASTGGDDFFLTSIVDLNEEDDILALECGRQQQQNENVLKKQRLLCNTSLDKIKIQFLCEKIEIEDADRGRVFTMQLPREMLRLQRREHFRMSIPLSTPLKCKISSLDPNHSKPAAVELNVHDISCGGLAMVTPAAEFTPELGAEYNCLIALPGTAGLRAVAQARNAFMVTLPNGKLTQRSGFAFVRPTESLLATVQRYIMGLERARRVHSVRW